MEYRPSAANLAMREWFQDAKFGLFVHWGVYSVLGRGEWVLHNEKITLDEYEKLPAQFNPVAFDARAWARLAKRAGMRYITITSKHHDGFAMWDSKVSDWDIVDRTPFQRDVLKELADACHAEGLKLFFYHSHLDWHHPDYYPRGATGGYTGRPESGDFERYLQYMDAQLAELLGGDYGELAGIWFDGWWDQQRKFLGVADAPPQSTQVDWRLERTYELIHRLQPAALIGNNHHVAPFPGEDFQMFEKDLPGHNTTGFSGDAEIGQLPLETCETINNSWGYHKDDHAYKSTRQLIHYLVRAAGYNANFLLNVGPMPTGEIQPEFVERLEQIGDWLAVHGEAIYGTRGGPQPPQEWGATTRRGDMVYVHVLDASPAQTLRLPAMRRGQVASARLLIGNGEVELGGDDSLTLTLPDAPLDPVDTIVVLALAHHAE